MIALPQVPGFTHREIDVAGVRWHVAQAGPQDGAAEPLVLVHGWPQHWYLWRHLAGELARDRPVIAPDLPGFGWSSAPKGSYAKDELAEKLLGLLDTLGIERFALTGHDWGGWVSSLIALRAPDRVSRLATLNIPHPWMEVPPPSPSSLKRISYQLVLGTPVLGERVLRHSPSFLRTIFGRAVHPGFTWSEDDLTIYVEPLRDPGRARASSALYRTFLTREVPALRKGAYEDRRFEMPALLLTGDRDPVVRPAMLEGAHGDDVRTGVIADCGHFSPEEQPAAVLAQLSPFLAQG